MGWAAMGLAMILLSGCGRIGFDPNETAQGSSNDGGGNELDGRFDDGGAEPLGSDVNIAFISSKTLVPGEIGGVGLADQWCTMLANQAGHAGNYVAWLSSSTSDVAQRLGMARGWQRSDGLLIADAASTLGEGAILHALNLDEFGNRIDDKVVTASRADGTLYTFESPLGDSGTCQDYTSSAGPGAISVGRSDIVGTGFSLSGGFSSGTCDEELHLYCFGVSNYSTPKVPPPPGRLAFLSANDWFPGGGLEDADLLCQGEANEASLPGTFKALLALGGASAASRFDLGGTPWYRVDGARMAATPMALMEGELDTALTINASGQPMPSFTLAWTGYGLGGPYTANDLGTDSCGSSWNSSGGAGGRAATNLAGPQMFSGSGAASCGSGQNLYCLEE